MTPDDKLILEAYVDKYQMEGVLEALGQIAHVKAVHIAENWQDTELAKVWSAMGDMIEAFAAVVGA